MIFECVFACTVVCLLVFERVLNACLVLCTRLVLGSESGSLKGYASVQMLGAGLTYASSLGGSLVQVLTSIFAAVFSFALWGAILMAGFSVLYVLQEYHAGALIEMVNMWNSSVGPVMDTSFVWPLRILDIVFSALVPIYNFLAWTGSQIFYNALVSNALKDITPYIELGNSVALSSRQSAISLSDYLETFVRNCPSPVTDLCYEPGGR